MPTGCMNIEAFLDYVSDPQSKMSDGKLLKKTINTLRREDSCCFLGALCEFAVINGVIAPSKKSSVGYYSYNDQETYPPSDVLKWIAFDFHDLRITENRVSVITANDLGELSFKEIADAIRNEIAKNVNAK
jgi:hypothetical protein